MLISKVQSFVLVLRVCSIVLRGVDVLNGGCGVFFFQAEDGIRDLVRSRGLGDVYKRQRSSDRDATRRCARRALSASRRPSAGVFSRRQAGACLLYTSDAADERYSVDLGGRRLLQKKNTPN